MKERIYRNLQSKMVLLTLLVSFTPLVILGMTLYYQFAVACRAKTEGEIRYRVAAQAEAVDRFLKERTAVLNAMADSHSITEVVNIERLSRIFDIMNSRCGGFVDLGVIDHRGSHLAYVGPYDLAGKNYNDQGWFAEVLSRGEYRSDVFTGYRKQPHFVIAVRRHEQNNPWILRATIDPNIVEEIVRHAQIGKTGDAYIVNRDGIFQTRPRFDGTILSHTDLDTSLFGGQINVFDMKGDDQLYAGAWLKDGKWLFVVQQEPSELMAGLFTVRFVGSVIIIVGLAAIVLTTVFTTRLVIARLRSSDKQMGKLNARLVQSDKLAALGKLAAGVAHEINNPLAVILQETGWMEDLLAEEVFTKSKNIEEYFQSLKKIEMHVERARKVVHGMLGFARKMEPRVEDVDINRTVSQTIDILRNYAVNNNIDIQTDLYENLPITASDEAQLQQVFFNLLTNAIDAIGKDGTVHIKTDLADGFIHIRIADTGPGIADDMKKKVFDPFFTTKVTGKGTGLGLWVTYSIIEKMKGRILVESEEGKGATFTVEVPIIPPDKK